jgi:hypothetical protein
MWEDFVIHAFLGVLQVVIKNPVKKAQLCHILTEVVVPTIQGMYPDGCSST